MTEMTTPPLDRCAVEPHVNQLAAAAHLPADRPLTMLNLLRFRDVADYSGHEELAPSETISGEEAYDLYGAAAGPHVVAAGAEIVYYGACSSTTIGPPGEEWDRMLLVRYPNAAAFVTMVAAPEYQAITGHRTAALLDSRLVPSTELAPG